ncbi:hypothetical protein LCGC14_2862620 [marine sediment metagenome]|uniref:Uncharacterized protein n=1 Tax=marine sediment metagenome TaxID=412755 RepID=A0A0F8Y534_9ZZZZ
MKAKVTINVLGVKVKEYETEITKMPDIAGFIKEMKELGVLKKVSIVTKDETPN